MERITLRIIAEECGISKYAVSRALSGKSGVSEATRDRVRAVALRLGYERPATKRGHTVVAALFEDRLQVNGELHSQIQTGLQSECARLGYEIQAHWLHHGDGIDAMIRACGAIAAINIQDQTALEKIARSGKPTIYSGWVGPLDPVDTVGGTDHEAGAAVARHLVALGHREIAYIHGPKMLRGRWERFYGLREVLELRPDCLYHDMVWDEGMSFSEALDALLAAGGRPTAFFCAHDGLALAAITDMLSRGWTIPGDVSIVGFGDFSPARQVSPPLTTVKVPGHEIGRAAIRVLHTRLTDPECPAIPVRHQVLNTLILRETTGPAPAPRIALRR